MNIKFLEIRDMATRIDVMAFRAKSDNKIESHYLRHSGFQDTSHLVVVVRLTEPMETQYDPYKWDGRYRTMPDAHRYIEEHFDELKTGDVVDVEFILGESEKPKIPERIEHLGYTE